MLALTIVDGDATRPQADAHKIIAHVCNDIGAWGRGFVHAISRRWPEPEREFQRWYRTRTTADFRLGAVQLVQVTADTWVANMVGQHGIATRDGGVRTDAGLERSHVPPIRYDAVRDCLRVVAAHALELNASVHMPRIGCGLAGGTWDRIEPLIVEALCARDVRTVVYDYRTGDTPQ